MEEYRIHNLMKLAGEAGVVDVDTFTFIAKEIFSSNRHYHNDLHAIDVYEDGLIIWTKDSMSTPTLLNSFNTREFAAFGLYHDVIYDATRTDNEIRSANVLVEHFSNYRVLLSFDEYTRVHAAILASAHHLQDQDLSDPRIGMMLDADLIGLSIEYNFDQNAKKIRMEFSHLSDSEFIRGRVAFFEKLLPRKRIYYTEEVYEEHEDNARDNIKRYIGANS